MKAAFAGQSDLRWVLQSQQLGTGHAVLQALPSIPDDHQVVVALGDVPLVSSRTLQRLVKDSADGDLALLTAVVDDPTGYGRVIRDERGEVERIVEDKDATDDERRVNEVNTGLMLRGRWPHTHLHNSAISRGTGHRFTSTSSFRKSSLPWRVRKMLAHDSRVKCAPIDGGASLF